MMKEQKWNIEKLENDLMDVRVLRVMRGSL